MNYPVSLELDDNDTVLVTFPDIPEAITFGVDEADALEHAADALATALSIYIQDRKDVPEPSAPEGRATVSLNLLGELKLALYQAVRAKEWRKADLARALNVDPKIVDPSPRSSTLFDRRPTRGRARGMWTPRRGRNTRLGCGLDCRRLPVTLRSLPA